MDAVSKPAPVAAQPQAAIQMNAMNPAAPANSQQAEHEHHHQHKASRLRGGGAGRDCFLGLIECFLCFECCKVRPRSTFALVFSTHVPTNHINFSVLRIAANAARTSSAALARCAAKRAPAVILRLDSPVP
ncbi:uncharacterized protein STEHIDRAFT_168968 [Stereum hirsutum FP-91666 SS1]|uniref:uncharacterized protein n=1 Tax=Stereum hirsutum (strain FP-91666) TaxID=721885 RepID=UPI000444A483|nr:uncharacterized protein STEHIDRAFT_168968 [Stereum hirsutum FP-91666 SS1]EIM85936.1 hypothetical protein STEHIDRAFT_168968 [Stereum hirsutum FP-91666 SS1]